MSTTKLKLLRRIIFLTWGIPILQAYAQVPDNLLLQNTTITTTATFEARNSITAGPNFTIAATGDAVFRTGRYIYLRPGITIVKGGKLQTVLDKTLVSVRTLETLLPSEFRLEQNYPNPFNPSTKITFALPKSSYVSLRVYNLLGEVVSTLAEGEFQAGYHSVTWDAKNVASGMYVYRLQTPDYVETRKLVLMK